MFVKLPFDSVLVKERTPPHPFWSGLEIDYVENQLRKNAPPSKATKANK